MAETQDRGYAHQVHGNTPEEERAAALVMADTTVRYARGSGSRSVRKKRDLLTVLLLLGLIEEKQLPDWFEEAHRKRVFFYEFGKRTQFRHRSEA